MMRMKKKNKSRMLPVAVVILLDVLVAELILAGFLLLHPGIIQMAKRQIMPAQSSTAPDKEEMTDDASVMLPEETEPPEQEPEVIDTRTEWQIRYADRFTEETVVTDHSYTSPEVAIFLETIQYGEGSEQVTYHVADIYVASIANIRTATANNEMAYYSVQDPMEIDAAANAILAISGDLYAYQPSGFLMRNGELYKADYTYCDICVLFSDGRMDTFAKNAYNINDILSQDPLQVWNFGPSLLDENGKVKTYYEVPTAVGYPNPRSAIGYYTPGHYCFVLVDGRQEGYSAGMRIPDLARVFEDLGCTCAYNLDGGGSALMTFLHERYSRQSNGAGREISDLILITEPGFDGQKEGAA